MGSEQEIVLDLDKAKSVKIPTGKKGITLRVMGNWYSVALSLVSDPSAPKEESVTLLSDCGAYSKTVKIEEGLDVEGGKKLVFERVLPGKCYSMEVNVGGGLKYFLFRNLKAAKELLEKVKHK